MLTRNALIGLVLFGVYLLIYSGFVLINAFSPSIMEQTPIPGVTLAIIYGLALIITAFVLSLLYGFLCRIEEAPKTSTNSLGSNNSDGKKSESNSEEVQG